MIYQLRGDLFFPHSSDRAQLEQPHPQELTPCFFFLTILMIIIAITAARIIEIITVASISHHTFLLYIHYLVISSEFSVCFIRSKQQIHKCYDHCNSGYCSDTEAAACKQSSELIDTQRH